MVTRHLMAKFYLWMLLALTISVAGAAAVVGLVSFAGWENRFTELVLTEMRVGRDVAANLMRTGMDIKQLERILSPLTGHTSTSVVIVDPRGAPIAVFAPPAHERMPGIEILPTQDDIGKILGEGSLLELEGAGRIAMGLPIELPSGETGVMFVTHGKGHWRGQGIPWRLLIGLGVFLVVLWLLCWPIAVHLVRPLRDMARTARALGEGDLTARIRLRRHRRDEVGSLAESFNTMAVNLEGMVAGHKQLIADISHELRSPLARLRVALELARQDAGEDARTYHDRVEIQADAMDGLIEELLTHARLETAPYSLKTEPLLASTLLSGLAESLQNDAEQKGVHIEIDTGPGEALNHPVHGDPALLGRAVSNVLRNALAHTPRWGRISLAGGVEGDKVTIRVRDTGPGVPGDMLTRIFEPFVRTDSARSPGTGGVGLGLAIARRCMEAHGGGVYAENVMDEGGLRVTLWWPAKG